MSGCAVRICKAVAELRICGLALGGIEVADQQKPLASRHQRVDELPTSRNLPVPQRGIKAGGHLTAAPVGIRRKRVGTDYGNGRALSRVKLRPHDPWNVPEPPGLFDCADIHDWELTEEHHARRHI